MPENKIITPETAEAMAKCYQEVEVEVRQAYAIIENARLKLVSVFGSKEEHHNFSLLPSRNGNYAYMSGKQDKDGVDECILKPARVTIWYALVEKLNFKQFLSTKRKDLLYKNIEDDLMGAITVENLFRMLEDIADNSGELVKEAMDEAYKYLKVYREHNGNRTKYKTNKKNARFNLGPKIILTMIGDDWCSGKWKSSSYKVCYRAAQELMVVDRVFHLLDGKSFGITYGGPLVDGINVAGQNDTAPKGETDYFRWKGYQNGNLHLEFKRLDLLAKLNAYCAEKMVLTGE